MKRSSTRPLAKTSDVHPTFDLFGLSVYRRPHLDTFLEACFTSFRVGIWTSSGDEYAAEIVRKIMPPNKVEFVWSRDRCGRRYDPDIQASHPTKPLKKLIRSGLKKERIVAIDDSPEKWAHSYGNLVRVKPYRGELEDDELQHLIKYLAFLASEPDVRNIEKRGWREAQDAWT